MKVICNKAAVCPDHTGCRHFAEHEKEPTCSDWGQCNCGEIKSRCERVKEGK
jgi:hypothetical protein